MSIRKSFYIVSIMYLASSLLMIFANNVKIIGSNRFLWAPAILIFSLLFYNKVYTYIKIRYVLLYGFIYCGVLQYTLWINASDWYKNAILNDFYYLISSIVLYTILYEYKYYKEWIKLAQIGTIFFIITGIMTIIATNIEPIIVRASYSSLKESLPGYEYLEKLGFGSYGYMAALNSFLPIIIYFIKTDKNIWINKNIWILILILFYFVLIHAQIFANILVAITITIMAIVGAKRFKKSMIVTTLVLIILFAVPNLFWSNLLIDLSYYFEPGSEINYKLNDFALFLRNPDILLPTTGAGGRVERYPMLLRAFWAQPFLGDASYHSVFTYELDAGGHLFWMSRLALWGIFGFWGYLIILKKIFIPILQIFDESFRFYYLLSLLSIVMLGLMKNLDGREIYIMLLIIIPGLYFFQFLNKK